MKFTYTFFPKCIHSLLELKTLNIHIILYIYIFFILFIYLFFTSFSFEIPTLVVWGFKTLCGEGGDPQKDTSCELASVTLKYNSWPLNTPLTLALIHHVGWITVLKGFGVMHTPPHSQTLIQTGLWSGQDPSWPLFHYFVAQSVKKTTHSHSNHKRLRICQVHACIDLLMC